MPQQASLFDTLRRDAQLWFGELREIFAARFQLAELEVRSDIDSTRRLGIVGGAGAVLVLTGLPVLAVLLAQTIASWLEHDEHWWLLAVGLFCCAAGAAVMGLAWRRFRRDFAGLRETLDELREDAAWLREVADEMTDNLPAARGRGVAPADEQEG